MGSQGSSGGKPAPPRQSTQGETRRWSPFPEVKLGCARDHVPGLGHAASRTRWQRAAPPQAAPAAGATGTPAKTSARTLRFPSRVLMNSHSSPLSAACLPANTSANSHHDERGRQQENMKEDFQGKGSVSHRLYTPTSRIYSDGLWLPSPAPSHPWHGVPSIGCEASLHLPLGPCLSQACGN